MRRHKQNQRGGEQTHRFFYAAKKQYCHSISRFSMIKSNRRWPLEGTCQTDNIFNSNLKRLSTSTGNNVLIQIIAVILSPLTTTWTPRRNIDYQYYKGMTCKCMICTISVLVFKYLKQRKKSIVSIKKAWYLQNLLLSAHTLLF